MKQVQLKNYPKFWTDVVGRIADKIDPSSHFSGALFELYVKEWYDLDVHIVKFGLLGEVYMSESDYVVFLLKWKQ